MNIEMTLLQAIKQLELSPTQYMRIKSSYEALSEELQKSFQDIDVYPQGSIRLGTTIKPYKDNKDASYDVDIVAQYLIEKSTISPQQVRDITGETLKGNGTYSQKITEKKRCWRIDYAEQDDLCFHADVLPSVTESQVEIQEMLTNPGLEGFQLDSIAITHKENSGGQVKWCSSNPKGYGRWFDIINRKNYGQLIEARKNILFTDYPNLFSSASEVPLALAKSPLQRVIQVLKRHRDVYFSNHRCEDDKPISIIITTLVAETVNSLGFENLSFIELLEKVTKVLIEAEGLIKDKNYSGYQIRKQIFITENGWYVPNPVNIYENFADAWNSDNNKAVVFFEWLRALDSDIVSNMDKSNFEEILCDKLALSNSSKTTANNTASGISYKQASVPWGTFDE